MPRTNRRADGTIAGSPGKVTEVSTVTAPLPVRLPANHRRLHHVPVADDVRVRPPDRWDARIKGRGVVGVGEAADLIHKAQLAWMPAVERRRYALTGPPPPGWFTDMQPAPWIDGHVIGEGQKLAGVSLVRVPSVTVPPGQDIHVPAQTRGHVPPDVPPPDTGTRPRPDPATTRRPGKHRAAGPR